MLHEVTKYKIERGNYEFTRVEFLVPDILKKNIEKEICGLTKDLDLTTVRDLGKMVKLTNEETEIFKTKGNIPDYNNIIEKHFGHYYRLATLEDLKNQPDVCEQVTRHHTYIPESVADLISNKMPEVVESLKANTDDPYTYVVFTNAPIGFPFSQKDDTYYQKFFPDDIIKDRHPTAEAFQYGLLKASGHSIDVPFPGRAFAQVTPDLSKVTSDDNRVWEEESSSQPFLPHIDGANYDEYSSQVCLAFGNGGVGSDTSFVHTQAALDQIDEMDSQLGRLSNGMGRAEVLKLDIFNHGPGVNSTCMNIVGAPVLTEGLDGVLRPRANLTDGRVKIREEQLPKLDLTVEDVQESIKSFSKACNNHENRHSVTLKTGQVISFSGELLHGRSAFLADLENPRMALRLRGTSEMH